MSLCRSVLPLCALLFCACSDDASHPHEGDASPLVDSVAVDAGVDTAVTDSTTSTAPACRDALSLAPLSLAPSYCLVARMPAPAGGAFALALNGSAPTLYSYEAGEGAREMVVRSYALDLSQDTLGTPTDHSSFSVAGTDDFYAGLYLARSGAKLAAGYTLADYSGDVVALAPAASPALTVAPGNFDAVYLADGTLLVNGLGLGSAQGQAVYALKENGDVATVIGAMGDGSGFLARGDSVLYAGYYDFAAGANKLYAFTLAEVQAALDSATPLSTSAGELAYDGDLADITASGDTLIAIDASFTEFHGVLACGATVSGDSVQLDAPAVVLSAEVVAGIPTPVEVTADGEVIGLRLAGDEGAEIVLIRKR